MEGLRVLAFTYREIPKNHTLTIQDEDHLVFLGLIAMMDPPREESKAAVAECIKAGIRPVMITGDHKITAAAIAKRVGILHDLSEACEGADIENMSDEELKEFVPNISDTVSFVRKFRSNFNRSLFIGCRTSGAICTSTFTLH